MLNKIRKKFGQYQAFLITNPTNIYFLTGFTGSRGMALITKKKAYFFTDFRYFAYAKKIIPKEFTLVQIQKDWKKDWPKLLKTYSVKSLGIEEGHMSYAQFLSLRKISKNVKFLCTKGIIEEIRAQKVASELKNIIKAQRIAEKILEDVKKQLKQGISEKDIEWFIIRKIHEYKADGPSFQPIVAFAEHSAIPHHQNTDRKLKKGDVVLIDMGVIYKHFCSDMTRTFFTKQPTKEQAHVYNVTLQAQKAAITHLKDGRTTAEISDKANKIIDKAKYLKNFQHALGHGVGLDIHELPNLGTEKPTKLQTNMIVTIEPGIYLENNFGVRIEDMVLITRTKGTNLTKAPKELSEVIIHI